MEYYGVKFSSVIADTKSWIAFVFNKGTNLEQVSAWMLNKYDGKGWIASIRLAASNKFFFVNVQDYTFEKAYKLRLCIENDMFNELHAIRVSTQDVMKTWPHEPAKTFLQGPPLALDLLHPERNGNIVVTASPQQIAWDKLADMVQEAKGKVGEKEDADIAP